MTRVLGRAALSCLLPLLVLSGCGDDGGSGPGVEPSSPESSTTSTEPTDDTTDTSTAAPTGPVLAAMSASVSAPEGWKLDTANSETNLRAQAPGPANGVMGLYDFGPTPGLSLREKAGIAERNFAVAEGQSELTFDGELGGRPAYVLTGSSAGIHYVDIGAVHAGTAVTVHFQLPSRVYTDAEQQELVDAVLATFEWS